MWELTRKRDRFSEEEGAIAVSAKCQLDFHADFDGSTKGFSEG
jgi:hypothetical protein